MILLSVILSFPLTLAVVQTQPVMENSYLAAVYEHNLIQNPDPRVPVSRSAALQHMQKNLDIYEEQAAEAAEQGVQILVFPEDGLHGFNFTRSSIYNYLETIPDPQQESWNPCTEPEKHDNTEVLQRLSCMARRNNLYLVANMPDLQPCPLSTDPSSTCPFDGRWQFNTNVVFRSDGLLVARYHKYNLFHEESFNTPPQPEIITFDTPFAGRFGLMICFDLLFHDPTIALVEKGVRQLIFPTAWLNTPPLLHSVQYHGALSKINNVTLLAANLRVDKVNMGGSGIYTPFFSTYHYAQRGEPEKGKLLVARVPVLDPEWLEQKKVTQDRSGFCQRDGCSDASSGSPFSNAFTSAMIFDPFSFVLLNEMEGKADVCHGSFCCHLQYRQYPHGGSKELYALGAFSGLHTKSGPLFLQICAVVRCAGSDPSSCGLDVEEAETKMDFQLDGKFETKYVYPSVLASRMAVEDPKHFEMAADGRVSMKHSNMKGGLLTACLYGRIYHLDKE